MLLTIIFNHQSFRNRLGSFKGDVNKVFGSFDDVDSSHSANFRKLKTATDNLQNKFKKVPSNNMK